MAKVKKSSRPGIREFKHGLFVKSVNRKKNLAGCSTKKS